MIIKKHPFSLHAYSFIHFFERFGYYGIASLLLLYLVRELNFTDTKSYAVFGVYSTLTYTTPLIGGYIADKFIGFYSALWLGLLFILFGHGSIFLFKNEMGLFSGLGLLATGSGFYKSNMTALIGNLYKKDDIRKDSAYTIFYVYQNLGSFFAPLICGYVGLTIGWGYGFSLAGSGAVCALIVLYFSKDFKRRHGDHTLILKCSEFQWRKVFLIIIGGGVLSVLLAFTIYHGEESLDLLMGLSLVYCFIFVKYYFSVEKKDRKNMIIIFFGVMAVALSGALISQGDTVFTLFMGRNVDKIFLNYDVPITFIQSVDPLSVIVLGPVFAYLWRYLSKKNHHIPGLIKTIFGFALIVLAYGYLYVLCHFGGLNHEVPLVSFVIGLLILASSDILIYPNVLTFCSRLTPDKLTGVIMGFVIFGMALSQLFGTYIARLASVENGSVKNKLASLIVYRGFFEDMIYLSIAILLILSIFVWSFYKKKKKNGS